MLSTIHVTINGSVTQYKMHSQCVAHQIQQPMAVYDYNQYMGGVDLFDQLVAS